MNATPSANTRRASRRRRMLTLLRDGTIIAGISLLLLVALAGTPEYEFPAELSDSRAARTRLDLDSGQLTTAERRELSEQSAAYDQWARERTTGQSTAYQAAEGQMGIDGVVVHRHTFYECVDRQVMTFVQQMVKTSEIVLGNHTKITWFVASLPAAEEKSNPKRNNKEHV